ncbi:MAG: hypothetical protein HYZ11_17185 [Candidatus Tectomicrobia bacterium]|uniref:Lipid A phosphate methyltransferase n=1 Tax=Tectimicrobiota bacterium TaxID=2528274 RepID=A0A932I104_UNCTE|nr:hypothetical protein [Candidatus Tectomicrobia bacterium]
MLRTELARQGARMYRWRGYLPLLMTPVMVMGFWNYHYPGGSEFYDMLWEILCLVVSGTGLLIRFLVMGYSPKGSSYVGESTARLWEGSLKTTGMYSLCRNPLYLGNFLLALGVFLFPMSLPVAAIFIFAFWLYYERLILGEEEFLAGQFGEEYLRWTERAPLIVPRLSGWVKPDVPFSWRKAVRREYKRIFGLAAIMTLLEIVSDFIEEGRLVLEPMWAALFLSALAFYLSVLFLKRKTRLLDVEREEALAGRVPAASP